MLTKTLNDLTLARGVFTFRNILIGEYNEEAKDIDRALRKADRMDSETYKGLLSRLNQICASKEMKVKNAVHLSGRSVLARLLAGDTTYSGEINYGALGSASTAISDTDTTLDTEVARKGVANVTRTDDSVTIDFYFSKADTNGTYEEFGTFIDGTSSADTGQMYNRVLTGGWTKSSSEAMTVSLQLDISNP